MFAEMYQDYLRKYVVLKSGIPSHDTICRVMGLISPDIMQQVYGKWQELLNRNEGEILKKIIAIDGKTMCGNGQKKKKANHIISAWSKEDGYCLGQKAVEEKSNEITAIPELLEKIRSKRADYVLALKGNQGTLYTEVKEYFADKEFQEEIEKERNFKKTYEKAHGQIEKTEYYQTENIKWLGRKKEWKGLKSIVMERKTIEKEGRKSVENRCFMSSLETDIETISRAVREHWSIESMHWHLDVTFREDANKTIDKTAAQNQNIIRKWYLSILKMAELPLKNKRLAMKKKRFAIGLEPV